MKKYIFRVIFYSTIILSIFAFGIDYDNSTFSAIATILGAIVTGYAISYKVLHGKSDKEISKIIGIPESFISE